MQVGGNTANGPLPARRKWAHIVSSMPMLPSINRIHHRLQARMAVTGGGRMLRPLEQRQVVRCGVLAQSGKKLTQNMYRQVLSDRTQAALCVTAGIEGSPSSFVANPA